MIRIILIFLAVFFSGISTAQEVDVPLESWKVYLPFNFARSLEIAGDNVIYCASREGLFKYNTSSQELRTFSMINGLSDFGINQIKYSFKHRLLVIGYENGNLDLFDGENFINNSSIKDKNITGVKRINHILIEDDFAYLSTGFGIVKLDIQNKEIKDRFIIGPGGDQLEVHMLTSDADSFYAATNIGIIQAHRLAANLSDFNYWTTSKRITHRPVRFVTSFGGQLAASSGSDSLLISRTNGSDTLIIQNGGVTSLSPLKKRLMSSSVYRAKIYEEDLKLVQSSRGAEIENVNQSLLDENGVYWFAEGKLGLVRMDHLGFDAIAPSGPGSANNHRLRFSQDNLLIASGGFKFTSYSPFFRADGIFRLKDGLWDGFNKDSYIELNGVTDLVDALRLGSDLFIASWGNGVYKISDDGQVEHYDNTNSTLQELSVGSGIVRVGALATDEFGNLWAANSSVQKTLVRRSPGGDWTSYRTGNISDLHDVFIDSYNQKWIIGRGGNLGLLGTNNLSFIQLGTAEGNGNLPGPVHSIAEDKDGTVWVGTDEGPALFFSPSQVISGQGRDAFRIKVEESGNVGFLLGGQVIQAIAIDGANRKWFGTQNGVWLISDDGEEEVYHFTTDNSPLLSNDIKSIAINPKIGEVFFGTSNGVCSFRGTSTDIEGENREVIVFPNPVRPDYEGLIAVNGLSSNSAIKITDITGNLVFQGVAKGNQAIWNGKKLNGERASTGVYLVFSIDSDGIQTMVSKILFIN